MAGIFSNILNDYPFQWALGQTILVNDQHKVHVNFYKLSRNSDLLMHVIKAHIRSEKQKDASTFAIDGVIRLNGFSQYKHFAELAVIIRFCHLECNLEGLSHICACLRTLSSSQDQLASEELFTFRFALMSAIKYGVGKLVEVCATTLRGDLRTDNVWIYYAIYSDAQASTALAEAVQAVRKYLTEFIELRFRQPAMREALIDALERQSLSLLSLVRILGSDRLNIASEESLLEVVIRIADITNVTKASDRKLNHIFDKLAASVRIGLISQARAREFLHKYAAYLECPAFKNLKRALFRKSKGMRVIGRSLETLRLPHEAILVFGGYTEAPDGEGSVSNKAFIFNIKSQSWHIFQECAASDCTHLALPHPLMSFSAVVVNRSVTSARIFIIGGEIHENQATQQMHTLHLSTGSSNGDVHRWRICAPMHEPRRDHVAVICSDDSVLQGPLTHYEELDFQILVTGGDNNMSGALDSCEMYSGRLGRWLEMAPMLQPRSAHASAYLAGRVYVLGGYSGPDLSQLTNTCEVMDLDGCCQWTRIQSMSQERYYCQALTHAGRVYVLGGGDEEFWSTVEAYLPETDQWQLQPQLRTQRADFAACQVNESFYCMGGGDDSSSTTCVEYWRPGSGLGGGWKYAPSLPCNVWGHRAVRIRGVDIIQRLLAATCGRVQNEPELALQSRGGVDLAQDDGLVNEERETMNQQSGDVDSRQDVDADLSMTPSPERQESA